MYNRLWIWGILQKNVHEHRGIYHLTNIYRSTPKDWKFKNNCNNNVGDCIHYSWDLKFVGKAIHENNENWIPANKKYFTVRFIVFEIFDNSQLFLTDPRT